MSNLISWEEYKLKKSKKDSLDKNSLDKNSLDMLEGATKLKKEIKKEPIFYDADTKYAPPYKDNYKDNYKANNSITSLTRCFQSHKPLKIIMGDKVYLIYGGSCYDPIIKDADIYVGFERGMKESSKSYPWSNGSSFVFPIVDGNVPSSIEDTKNLLKYLSDNLIAGKKIHLGCVGGHGRTGTILSALVKHMTGNNNAIEYVRTNYCEKSVESATQIDWLHKYFDIDKVKPSKDYSLNMGGMGVSKTYKSKQSSGSNYNLNAKEVPTFGYSLIECVKPVRVKGSIWGF